MELFIYGLVSYVLLAISLMFLSKTSLYYENKLQAWIPITNQFLYCKLIGDKHDVNLEKGLMICYGIALGAFILSILAAGSVLGYLLRLCLLIAIFAGSIVNLTATYLLIKDALPYAKVVFIFCIIFNLASTWLKLLNLVQPIVILASCILIHRKYFTDEELTTERMRKEQKYQEELERERLL